MVLLDEILLKDQVDVALRAIPNLQGRVYVGFAPEKVPEINGFVLPYVVLFAGLAGDLPLERCLAGEVDLQVLDWSPQVNCVGPDADQALAVAVDVKKALTGLRVGNHWLKPDVDAMRVSRPVLDTQVTPARFFLPVNMNVITN